MINDTDSRVAVHILLCGEIYVENLIIARRLCSANPPALPNLPRFSKKIKSHTWDNKEKRRRGGQRRFL